MTSTVSDISSRIAPYIEELADNRYARENLRSGIHSLRDAYGRSQKRRVKAARDERLRRQLRAALLSITEGVAALKGGRTRPKKRGGRGLLMLLAVAGAGGALARSRMGKARINEPPPEGG